MREGLSYVCVCVCVCVHMYIEQSEPAWVYSLYEPPAETEAWDRAIQTYNSIPLSGLENRLVVTIHLMICKLKGIFFKKSSITHWFLTFFCFLYLTFFFPLYNKWKFCRMSKCFKPGLTSGLLHISSGYTNIFL